MVLFFKSKLQNKMYSMTSLLWENIHGKISECRKW